MFEVLLPVILTACAVHPADLDSELGRRALPWLPPDLARQVARHPQDFIRGAAAAAAWPAEYHQPGGPRGVEQAILAQCERTSLAIRNRSRFSDVVAGLGTLAHLVLDLTSPFASDTGADPHARSFAHYLRSCSPRVPIVFYGQRRGLVNGNLLALTPYLQERRNGAASLASLVREDLDRHGGPGAWQRLDDRSTSFAAASLTLNHAASLYANLASWVWLHGGGLVPQIPAQPGRVVVWKGDPRPREFDSSHFGIR